MSPSHIFILRPIATSLIMVAILLTGFLGYQLLPISSLPEVDYPTIQVVTFYPGASPDVMASAVTAPLEKQFGQMPGLSQMTSSSSDGSSLITLQFDLNLGLDIAEQEVQAAINAATTYLPNNLPNPPIYNKVNPADTPIMTLALTSNTLPLFQVEDFADTRLAQRISQLSGVGLVSISGGQRPAIRVQVNPTILASYSLNLEDVRTAIVNANVNAAKGNFDGSRLAYTINSNDQLLTSEAYKPLIITYKNGAPVRLSDIAHVIDAPQDIRMAAWMNHTPAVIMNIQRQPGANVIAVVDQIKQLLPRLRESLPNSIRITTLTDRTLTIRASIKEVQFDLMLSIILVVLVIFLFLRHLPATLIPSAAVPLSLVGTFGIMYLFGFSLNNLTLMALTIATGFVVDDAIVMIENITRYVENGVAPLEAALKGAKQIGFTILSLTVSLIAVLIPLLFMSDVIGRLFREFAMTLSITILISAFVSLTLTPMLCARILHHRDKNELNSFERRSEILLNNIIARYGTSLRWILGHQRLTLFIAILTLIITFILFYMIPKGFFPEQDTGMIQGISEAAQSISFSEMSKQQQALANIVLQDPAVENISSFIGIDGINTTLNSGRLFITLKPLSQRDASASDIIRRLQLKLMAVLGAKLYLQPVQDLSVDDRISRNQYQYSLNAPDLTEVNQWTKRLIDKLHNSPELQDVTSDIQNLGLQTFITIDRDTASRLGISTQTIDDTLYDAFGQRLISTMFTQRNQYYVILENMPSLATGQEALKNIYIHSGSTGVATPLSAFTHMSSSVGDLVIHRQDQFPATTISFNLTPNTALGSAIQIVGKATEDLGIPPNIQTSFEGSAKIFQSSLANEIWLILAAIVVVYIVLGVLYESYIHPLTILSTLPSACMGALFTLILTRHSLTIIAVIGIILLIGIVMKNAIMMIDFALEQERFYKKSPVDAIYEASLLRFRPIIMTTFASILGAFPLAFGSGMGAELRQPLGIVIISGLMVSQVLTLYTTPVIYLAFDQLARQFDAFKLRFAGTKRQIP